MPGAERAAAEVAGRGPSEADFCQGGSEGEEVGEGPWRGGCEGSGAATSFHTYALLPFTHPWRALALSHPLLQSRWFSVEPRLDPTNPAAVKELGKEPRKLIVSENPTFDKTTDNHEWAAREKARRDKELRVLTAAAVETTSAEVAGVGLGGMPVGAAMMAGVPAGAAMMAGVSVGAAMPGMEQATAYMAYASQPHVLQPGPVHNLMSMQQQHVYPQFSHPQPGREHVPQPHHQHLQHQQAYPAEMGHALMPQGLPAYHDAERVLPVGLGVAALPTPTRDVTVATAAAAAAAAVSAASGHKRQRG